jgi:tRNA nucleotidyltransferase/poly(A) polymerase
MIEDLIKEVEATVSPIYLVGGSVRDMILKKEPKDYDFCTPLQPDVIERMVRKAKRRPYLTGQRFGTIGFKCAGQHVEVTTFRNETYIMGSRKPQVEFVTDLKEDLSRRDFTINAIAYKDGKFYDPFGGRLDILARKIKAVGDASDRFKEDPLRMLRAARFTAQLGFEVDPNMIGKARKMAWQITTISRERWVQELDKLLTAEFFLKGFGVLADMRLMPFMLPEILELGEPQELQFEMFDNILAAPNDADYKWGAMLMNIGKPAVINKAKYGFNYPHFEKVSLEMARGICLRLKFSKHRMNVVEEIVKTQQLPTA